MATQYSHKQAHPLDEENMPVNWAFFFHGPAIPQRLIRLLINYSRLSLNRHPSRWTPL